MYFYTGNRNVLDVYKTKVQRSIEYFISKNKSLPKLHINVLQDMQRKLNIGKFSKSNYRIFQTISVMKTSQMSDKYSYNQT